METDEWRYSAETRLREQNLTDSLTVEEALHLIGELRARHQTELELQNKALRETRAQLEQSLERCAELYQAEALLWERERQFLALLRTAPAGVGITQQRVIRQVNDHFCRMLGYSHAELIGQSVRLIYPSDVEFDRVGQEKHQQITDTGFGAVETQWCCKDGRLVEVLLRSTAVVPHQPESGIVFAAVDVSESKQMEAALRKSEQRYRALVSLLPYGVQENDCEGRITFANPALERLHGQLASSVVGRFIWDFSTDDAEREQLRDYLRYLVREQPPPETYYSKDRCVDGSIIDVQVDWTYYRNEEGQLQGFISVVTDITERRKIETRLVEHTERLQSLSRRLFAIQEEERRRLARELHDDFGQQLAAIKMNLAVLERNLDDARGRRPIADSLELIDHTLKRLRDVARDLRPSLLDDLGLAAALHDYARRQAERAGCKITVSDQIPPLFPEVETAVFRIVQEAVNNAIRHGSARSVAVAVQVHRQMLQLMIQDDGCGFDPIAAAGSDAGLGLQSMRERAALLNGWLTLSSQPGQGAIIEVGIPLDRVIE